MLLRQIYDPSLAQFAYLIGCQRTGQTLVIDPERDIDRYHRLAAEHDLKITAVAETHIHADFVSGAAEFAADPDIHLYLSAEGGEDWSYRWTADRAHVHYLRHDDEFRIGNIVVRAIHSPGHTPEHLSFLITDIGGGANEPVALASGDFLFVGDVGRPDLLETAAGVSDTMKPAAQTLRTSLVERLGPLPEFVQVLPGHGAGSACGKALGAVPTSVLGYERRFNQALILANRDAGEFVQDILNGQPEPPLYFGRMKQVNRDGIRVTGGVAMPPRLVPAQLRPWLDSGDTAILDTRPDRDEFDAAHLAGSLHCPYPGPFFLAGAGSYVAPEQPILLLVDDPAEVESMTRQLYRIGLDHVIGFVTIADLKQAAMLDHTIARVDFASWREIGAREGEQILDVRNVTEFQEGHLDGSINIAYTRLKARIGELPTGKRLLIHCGSGKRAALAASFLASKGFDVVHVDGICSDCDRIAAERGLTH